MIVKPGFIPTIPEYVSFSGDASKTISTASRYYVEAWVDIADHTKFFGPQIWTPAMLGVNGIDGFGGNIDLPDLANKSWTGTSTFKLLDKDGAALWTMVSTIAFDVSYDVSTYPPAVFISSHGSLSNAYPDGLFYAGVVNGFSINTVWAPANNNTTPPYFSANVGTFELLPITGCVENI